MKETQDILSSIAQGEFSPIYLLMGKETFFIDQISNQLIEKVVEEAAKDFDLTVLYGKETSVEQILEAAKRFPMMGDRQLIVVREAQYLEKTLELLEPYLANPQQQTVLVLCYMHKTVDKRKKIYKSILKQGLILESKPLNDYKIGSWIEQRGKTFGFSLHPHAVALLVTFLGSNLSKIDKELEKLSLNIEEGSVVTTEEIERFIGFSKEFNSFELNNALAQRNLTLAFRIVHNMAANPKQHPIQLTIVVVFNFFQKLFMYHGLSSSAEASKVLGVSPYFVKDYSAAAKKYSMKQTAKVLGILKEMDLKSKGVGAQNLPLEEVMKEMILKIVSV
ncbi:MAG: DNA polymerase III subunit delta [Flavobacteriaceae bacterium]